MTEETTFTSKSKPEAENEKTSEMVKSKKILSESSFMGISIKAWLALIVIGTLCLCEIFVCFITMTKTNDDYVVSNEMYMIAGIILAHYFKDKPVPPPSNTTTTTSSETTKPII